MRKYVVRVSALLLGGVATYKATVILFASRIPGDPFHGFGSRDWFEWLFLPTELAFIVAVLLAEYGLLFFATRKLTPWRAAIWGAFLGPYAASLLFPFDLMSVVDNLPAGYLPPGILGAGLEIAIFFVVIPLSLAVLVSRAGRTSSTPSSDALSGGGATDSGRGST